MRRLWWSTFALLLVIGGTWALAVPPMTGMDEPAHAVRAAAVARGELVGNPVRGSRNYFVEAQVPEAYARSVDVGACFAGEAHWNAGMPPSGPPRLKDCPTLEGSSREVDVTTYQNRVQPTYYFLVGLPTLVQPGELGFYLMRVVSVGLCSALLATGLIALLRLRSRRYLLAGAFLALTPTVIYLAGTVNPGGLELSAAFCAWACGLALARSHKSPHWRQAAGFGLALAILALTRAFGPAFVVLIVATLWVVAPRGRVRQLWQDRAMRIAAVGAVAAGAAGTAWIIYIQTQFPVPHKPGSGIDVAAREFGWWLREMVGVFSAGDVAPPTGLQIAWGGGLAALALLAWRHNQRRNLLVSAALTTAALALIVSGEAFSVPDIGFFWQGRYILPIVLGVPLLLSVGGNGARVRDRHVGPTLIALTVGIHVWSLIYALRHYTLGWTDKSHNPFAILFHPIWSPPLPSIVLAGAYTAALISLAGLLWRAASRGELQDTGHDAEIHQFPPAHGHRLAHASGGE